jgi:hypothetical protein
MNEYFENEAANALKQFLEIKKQADQHFYKCNGVTATGPTESEYSAILISLSIIHAVQCLDSIHARIDEGFSSVSEKL